MWSKDKTKKKKKKIPELKLSCVEMITCCKYFKQKAKVYQRNKTKKIIPMLKWSCVEMIMCCNYFR